MPCLLFEQYSRSWGAVRCCLNKSLTSCPSQWLVKSALTMKWKQFCPLLFKGSKSSYIHRYTIRIVEKWSYHQMLRWAINSELLSGNLTCIRAPFNRTFIFVYIIVRACIFSHFVWILFLSLICYILIPKTNWNSIQLLLCPSGYTSQRLAVYDAVHCESYSLQVLHIAGTHVRRKQRDVTTGSSAGRGRFTISSLLTLRKSSRYAT